MGDAAILGEHVCMVSLLMFDLGPASSYHCDVVNRVKGCCKDGRSCSSCTTDGYAICPGEDLCCPKPFPLHNPCLPHLNHPLFTFSFLSSGKLRVLPRRRWFSQMSQRPHSQLTNRLWKRVLRPHSKTNQYLPKFEWQCRLCRRFEVLFRLLRPRAVARLDG